MEQSILNELSREQMVSGVSNNRMINRACRDYLALPSAIRTAKQEGVAPLEHDLIRAWIQYVSTNMHVTWRI